MLCVIVFSGLNYFGCVSDAEWYIDGATNESTLPTLPLERFGRREDLRQRAHHFPDFIFCQFK